MKLIALAALTLLAMHSAVVAAPSAATGDDLTTLRRLRAENNQALAARDLGKTMSIVADDYVLVGGNDGIYRSKADMQTIWASDFADAKSLPCVRTPDRFEFGEYDGIGRSAETGSWECPAATARGEERLWGRYLAHWSKRSGSWKVVSDNYVTLGCRGGGCHTAP